MPPVYDAVVLIAFGGPTRREEIRPFLENVSRGRAIPPARLDEVARQYELIGGRSPLNEITFRQAEALCRELSARGARLPVYVGMRNWAPYLHQTLAEMTAAGHRRAIGVILSAQQCEASWDRYIADVGEARERAAVSLEVDFAPEWHAHPGFIDAVAEQVRAAFERISGECRAEAALVFTAHSIPVAMADESPYVQQVAEGARLVAERVGHPRWSIAYQSRSGNPREAWLEPDIRDVVRQLAAAGTRDVVVAPIGFVCDHAEVLYDLDIEARRVAEQEGTHFVRAGAVNDHPAFIRMLADIVSERAAG